MTLCILILNSFKLQCSCKHFVLLYFLNSKVVLNIWEEYILVCILTTWSYTLVTSLPSVSLSYALFILWSVHSVTGISVRQFTLPLVFLSDSSLCHWYFCQTVNSATGISVRQFTLPLVFLSDSSLCHWYFCQTVHSAINISSNS